jgi:6-phosphogluconolactonase (cycloisomerase 2 family)
MATPTGFSFPPLSLSHLGFPPSSCALRLLFILSILLRAVPAVEAQTTQQQYVYGSGSLSPASSLISGFSKASPSGALSQIPGSPFNERFEGGLVAVDGQGKFLFVLNPKSNDISMFQIDPASGALSEVPASPFQVPPTVNPNLAPSQPISIAAEKSGKFLFVGYYLGDFQGSSAVVTLSINVTGSSPVLIANSTIPTNSRGAPAQLLTDPKGHRLYVGLSHGQNNVEIGGAEVYSIDPSSGALGYLGIVDSPPAEGRTVALDPLDRFFFVGWGGNIGALDSCVLSPVDGTALAPSSTVQLGFNNLPTSLIAENSGKFLYVTNGSGTGVYSIDPATGALNPAQGPLSSIFFTPGSAVADPMGPFIYSVLPSGIHVYQVGQPSGNLVEIPGSPFNAGMRGMAGSSGIAISGNPIQAVSGPAATIFPATANFSATVGATSPTQVFSIVNIGDQTLAINSISIAGLNASSFSQINTCASTLSPNANCSVSINFKPAASGPFSATLQVADNASGTPQTLALNGTGVAPAPNVAFSPAAPSFPTITQGTSGIPQTLTVISSGTAPLHVSAVSLGGPNPSDFSLTNNCTAPVVPSMSCTISVAFNPVGPGQRAAILTITDDVAGSPQTIALSATANPAFTAAAAPGGSTTASVTAGQMAQYQMQLTPGLGYSGTISLTCSGAPLAATCQVPASVALANGALASFTVIVSTTSAAMLPLPIPMRRAPRSAIRLLLLLVLAMILVIAVGNRGIFDRAVRARRMAWSGALTARHLACDAALTSILFCLAICGAGCGSGSASVAPQPIVTPSGTSTITITTAAMSPTQQPLQLPPIQLTLTVK